MIIELREINMNPININFFNNINVYVNEVKFLNFEDTKKFLLENKNNGNITILIRNCDARCLNNNKLVESTFFNELILFIYENVKILKFIIFTEDWWFRPQRKRDNTHNNMISHIFNPSKNINILTYSNKQVISKFHNKDYNFHNNIHSILCHYVNKKSIQNFNKTPKNQISLFGHYNIDFYPYRHKFTIKNQYIIKHPKLSYDKFLEVINNSFACFTTSVHPLNFSTNKHESSNCILLKVFEILAGGSLLLYPKDEEQYLNEIGLYDKQNCWLIDMNKNIPEQCSYITNPNNRTQLEKIRFAGYNHAITNLTQEKLLKPLIDFFEKIN